jgi:hypothetical protein
MRYKLCKLSGKRSKHHCIPILSTCYCAVRVVYNGTTSPLSAMETSSKHCFVASSITHTEPQTATAELHYRGLAHQPHRHDRDVVGRVVHEPHGLVGAGLGLHALHHVDGLSLQLAEAAVRLAVRSLRACSGTQCVCNGRYIPYVSDSAS